jgi:hypothetical protein
MALSTHHTKRRFAMQTETLNEGRGGAFGLAIADLAKHMSDLERLICGETETASSKEILASEPTHNHHGLPIYHSLPSMNRD